jgi:hypothetical protein
MGPTDDLGYVVILIVASVLIHITVTCIPAKHIQLNLEVNKLCEVLTVGKAYKFLSA